MRYYACGKCKKTVTKVKWWKNLAMFTATPICLECWKLKEEKERKEKEYGN